MPAAEYRERVLCDGSAPVVPPTFTSQHKGVMFDRATGRMRFFTKAKMRDAQERWRDALRQIRAQFDTPAKGAVRVHVALEWPWPKSAPLWRRECGAAPKDTKPDLDNILKGLLDVMSAMQFWEDDGQVAEIHAAKRHAERGAVRIRVAELVPVRDRAPKRGGGDGTAALFEVPAI